MTLFFPIDDDGQHICADDLEGFEPPPSTWDVKEVQQRDEVFSDPSLRRAGYVLALETIPREVWQHLYGEKPEWRRLYRRAYGYEYDKWDLAIAAIAHYIADPQETRLEYLLTTNPIRQWLWHQAQSGEHGVETLVPVRALKKRRPLPRCGKNGGNGGTISCGGASDLDRLTASEEDRPKV